MKYLVRIFCILFGIVVFAYAWPILLIALVVWGVYKFIKHRQAVKKANSYVQSESVPSFNELDDDSAEIFAAKNNSSYTAPIKTIDVTSDQDDSVDGVIDITDSLLNKSDTPLEEQKPSNTDLEGQALIDKAESIIESSEPEPQPKEALKQAPAPKSKRATMRFSAAGTRNHHQKEFKQLIKNRFEHSAMNIPYEDTPNSEIKEDYDWGITDPVFEIPRQLNLGQLKFIPEPDNAYNDKAIKIVFENDADQTLIGYVPDAQLERANKYIDNPNYEVSYKLTGGKYKVAREDDYDDKIVVRVQGKDNPYGLQIKFYKKG